VIVAPHHVAVAEDSLTQVRVPLGVAPDVVAFAPEHAALGNAHLGEMSQQLLPFALL
jgi:hypothetical protein